MDTMTRSSGWAGSTGRTGFNGQLHHLWQTRPVRLPQHGPVAGVAAGFGRRYGVDPVLVRVAFVVSTIFGGSGVVLYLLGWLLLPAAQDQVSAAEGLVGRGRSSQSPTKTVVLIVAPPTRSARRSVGAGLGGARLISFALMLAGWWMLFCGRRSRPPTASTRHCRTADSRRPDIRARCSRRFPWGGTAYGPFTKLPDHYEPERPKDAAAGDISAQQTEVIAQESSPERDGAATPSNDARRRTVTPRWCPTTRPCCGTIRRVRAPKPEMFRWMPLWKNRIRPLTGQSARMLMQHNEFRPTHSGPSRIPPRSNPPPRAGIHSV